MFTWSVAPSYRANIAHSPRIPTSSDAQFCRFNIFWSEHSVHVIAEAVWYLSCLLRSMLDESQNWQENNVKNFLGPGGRGELTFIVSF